VLVPQTDPAERGFADAPSANSGEVAGVAQRSRTAGGEQRHHGCICFSPVTASPLSQLLAIVMFTSYFLGALFLECGAATGARRRLRPNEEFCAKRHTGEGASRASAERTAGIMRPKRAGSPNAVRSEIRAEAKLPFALVGTRVTCGVCF